MVLEYGCHPNDFIPEIVDYSPGDECSIYGITGMAGNEFDDKQFLIVTLCGEIVGFSWKDIIETWFVYRIKSDTLLGIRE